MLKKKNSWHPCHFGTQTDLEFIRNHCSFLKQNRYTMTFSEFKSFLSLSVLNYFFLFFFFFFPQIQSEIPCERVCWWGEPLKTLCQQTEEAKAPLPGPLHTVCRNEWAGEETPPYVFSWLLHWPARSVRQTWEWVLYMYMQQRSSILPEGASKSKSVLRGEKSRLSEGFI